MIHYLKHAAIPIVMLTVTVGMLLGGAWLWFGLSALVVLLVGGDAISPDDLSQPRYRHKWILNMMLYLTVPLMFFQFLILAWLSGQGAQDLLGIGAFVSGWLHYDALAARNATAWYHFPGAFVGLGLVTAGYATNVAHELTHRTGDPAAMLAGRWLLGFSLNPDFAIEHVYGHHEKVGTWKDPAQARRGDNVYWFIVRSTVLGHISAWKIEMERLRRKRIGVLSVRNRMLTGYGICAAYIGAFAFAGGAVGALFFVVTALLGKAVLEIVNYIEHYGLIRIEGQPVQPRHSWNTNRLASSILLFSLTRHSAHHEKGDLPFWELKPYPEAPEMPFGYLSTIGIALLPPLWHRLMAPVLANWDANQASPQEREVAREENLRSGIPALRTAGQSVAAA